MKATKRKYFYSNCSGQENWTSEGCSDEIIVHGPVIQ
ncbi:hypothetical protein CCACVL1_19571 [Corchorus capsularis]|uniref:Uncharacterized protein n=1 Tax=Corchorus capsularis TaxID=210143 RepID=A0A1R3HFY0_COCAP|nr:hypothetical protein CCACVL1_19571 [Corchorus capsularis]